MPAAVSVVPVFLTGEPTEEIVEHRPGVTEKTIHDHQEAAEVAMILVCGLGAGSLVALLWGSRGRELPKSAHAVLVIGAFLSLGLIGWTAHLGGLIRHDELRAATTSSGRDGGEIDSHGDSNDD